MKKIILCLMCTGLLAACGGKKSEEESASPAAASEGQTVYRVTTEMLNIPLVIRDAKNESGFELDLLKAIAEKQNMKLQFQLHPWQGIFNTLDDGSSDIVAGAVTYSKERAERMDMTEPHFEYEFAMLANKQAAGARNFADLRGKNVALKRDSIAETLIPMFGTSNESNIVRTTSTWEAIKSVLADESAAAAGSSAVMRYYLREYQPKNSSLTVVYDSSLPKKQYVFAVKKGNTALVKQLNEGLVKVRADGTYDALYKKYWPQ